MKTKPILFSTEMVQAILDGSKTQTRRKLKDFNQHKEGFYISGQGNYGDVYPKPSKYMAHFKYKENLQNSCGLVSPYQLGDILWVRETWNIIIRKDSSKNDFLYKAWGEEYNQLTWKPSIHMPKEAARIFLKVTNVRCERLHDISEGDAIAEGCSLYGPFGEYKGSIHPNGGGMRYRAYSTAKRAFQCIWETINCEESWKQNPFVWVYEFEVTEKPENF